jgi:hypothetical protein
MAGVLRENIPQLDKELYGKQPSTGAEAQRSCKKQGSQNVGWVIPVKILSYQAFY